MFERLRRGAGLATLNNRGSGVTACRCVTRSHDVIEFALGRVAVTDHDASSSVTMLHLLGSHALDDHETGDDHEKDASEDEGGDGTSIGIILPIQMKVDAEGEGGDLAGGEG